MTFEQFAAVVRDWSTRMTPAQVRSAAESIVQLIDDLPCETTLDTALATAAKSEPVPALDGEVIPPNAEATRGQQNDFVPRRGFKQRQRDQQPPARGPARSNSSARAAQHGPQPGDQVEAAARAAEIPKRALLAATDALGVRTERGEWRLPGRAARATEPLCCRSR